MLEENGLGMEDAGVAVKVTKGVDCVFGDVDRCEDEPLVLLDSRRRLEYWAVYQVSEVTFSHKEDRLEVARSNTPIILTETG